MSTSGFTQKPKVTFYHWCLCYTWSVSHLKRFSVTLNLFELIHEI